MRIAHQRAKRPFIQTTAAERQGGYVLVMFAMLLIPILLFVGFSVDVGSWYSRASDMQKAADAASLAGVVWLPDLDKARDVAKETAKKNGFDDADPNIDVIVAKSTTVPNRLQVSIRDRRVGSFFYSNLGGSDLDMKRNAYAEYVTPVPLGSPRNYFGTGSLVSGSGREYLYQSVNPYCTSKANGDRHQAGFDSGPTGSHNVTGRCVATPENEDFRTSGYELYIDAVAGRPGDIELRLLDPQYTFATRTLQVETGQNCTTTYTYTWGGAWTVGQNDGRVYGPAQVQTRGSTSSGNWQPNPPYEVASGSRTNRLDARLYRYRSPLTTTPNTTCVPTYSDQNYGSIDMSLNGNNREEDYTYVLYGPDDTPLNDTDNPELCRRTISRSTPFDDYTYLGTARWLTLNHTNNESDCLITTGMRSGRYILRVRNANGPANLADGSNNWGVVARYTNASDDGICDGRTDPMCPRVYGKDAISVRAVSDAEVADFFLAEIGPEHAGKKLRIELWDPGEGGNSIEILSPDGTESWTPATFDWSEPANGSGNNVDILPVRDSDGDFFNSRLVTITVDLTGYNPPDDNNWWKIRYRFRANYDVTDRTTWSARILGDPVHLIEE